MSYLTYIASDYPLPIIKNPHEQLLSVNEALALGVEDIPDILLAPDIDRDKPEVILYSDREVVFDIDRNEIRDGAFADDFALLQAEGMDDVYSEKKYKVYLEWNYYTEERADQVIEYIRDNLFHTDEVEIWRIWMGTAEKPTIRSKRIPISELKGDDIRQLEEKDLLSESDELYGLPVQYRLLVTKER